MKQLSARALKNAIKSGGATIHNGEVVNLTKGYVVGNGTLKVIDMIKHGENIFTILKEVITGIKQYGLWVNEGKLYVDKIEVIVNKEEAVAVAKSRKELAIWDNANAQEITTS